MDRTFSTFLDAARLLAAVLVFIHHAEQILKDHRLSVLASFGHDAVIFFFLLSGFVIGFVSDGKERTLRQFAVARLARLYSVVVPAVLLTALLVQIGAALHGGAYLQERESNWLAAMSNTLLFIGQSWSGGVELPTNGPFWSVCYEAWFYAIFGAAHYLTGGSRAVVTLLLMLLAGPKILLLMPIWLVGLACYRHHHRCTTRRALGYFAIVLALTSYLLMRAMNWDDQLSAYSSAWFGGAEKANELLGFSKRFLPDYVIAGLFVLMLYGFYMIRQDLAGMLSATRPGIVALSRYTFSLYTTRC
jgi:peptidoglycan/LPS O-acetylase OafA/YrhL